MTVKLLDCTLRDGGYYNDWDYSPQLISDYLSAMSALNVDYVEIGLRSLINQSFKGGCAFSTEEFLSSLDIPEGLRGKVGVMVNGSELVKSSNLNATLDQLFVHSKKSHVSLVRIACHVDEFLNCLPAVKWLKQHGYQVGFNLMQVADRSLDEITQLAIAASDYPIDVLYFADSMGSLLPADVSNIVSAFKSGWSGNLGIHTHDNMSQAIANSIQAINDGVTWVDATVTGMGRGPGNAQTEYLYLAIESFRKFTGNPIHLFEVIRKYFKPMQNHYGWGTNPFYFLAGKFGIHPTYIQSMLQDSRYSEEDVLAVIEHLKVEGGKRFNVDTLEAARHFYSTDVVGTWKPSEVLKNRAVLILGSGPGVEKHYQPIERFIKKYNPFVIALNTQQFIAADLINARAACHPIRLLADCQEHCKLPQPLITPASMLPDDVKNELKNKELWDFGLAIDSNCFEVTESFCKIPSSLVVAYALAVTSSGQAKKIFLAGFDGYGADDPRRKEMDNVFKLFASSKCAVPIVSLTPTRYEIEVKSIFGVLQ